MTSCPVCGFDLWKYNRSTYTCKHGHRFGLDLKPVPAQPVYIATPQPAVSRTEIVERKQPLLLAALCGGVAGALVDVVLRLAGA